MKKDIRYTSATNPCGVRGKKIKDVIHIVSPCECFALKGYKEKLMDEKRRAKILWNFDTSEKVIDEKRKAKILWNFDV